jgi:type I restriction enzyme S subunit
LHELMAGVTSGLGQRRQRVQIEQFLSLHVPVATILEQSRISARLDRLYHRRQMIAARARRANMIVVALRDSLCTRSEELFRVGDLIALRRRPVRVEPSGQYEEIGLRSFGRGIFHKDPTLGLELGNKRVFRICPSDLVVSNVFAWEGAIAVAGEDERGKIGSHRFLTYQARDAGTVEVEYLLHLFLSTAGLPLIQSVSPGAAGRNRTLGIKAFEDLRVPLPSIGEQRRIASLLDRAYEVLRRIENRERTLDALMASALNKAFADVG